MAIHDRAMIYIDGSSLLAGIARHFNVTIRPEKPPPDAFKLAHALVNDIHGYLNRYTSARLLRATWFGSYRCDDKELVEIRETLRSFHFDPVVFKRGKERREKGVDIAVTKHMLVDAIQHNFEVGILVAGDADYRVLLDEAKRYGSAIRLSYFKSQVPADLRIAADDFYELPYADSAKKQEIPKLVEAIKASTPAGSEQRPCEECGGSGKVNW